VEGLWLDAGKSDNVEELEQYLTLVLEAAE
jgi:hypothetical protein